MGQGTELKLTMKPRSDNPMVIAAAEATAMARQKHILSIDLEDYFHVEAFAGSVSREQWSDFPARVEVNTHRLLDIFDRFDVKATFFVLGWVAWRFPGLVRQVQERGHDLACHSYWHRRIYTLTPNEFRADTRQARDTIEQIAGVRVSGYRAPSWSVTKDSLWALDILADEGFTYDSSIFPIRHDIYGIPNASRYPYFHAGPQGEQLLEIPPATLRISGTNLPAAGGGYFRIFPMAYTEWAFRQFESELRPLVFYLHPWELDPEQPRIAGPLKSRLRHYTNLGKTQKRLERLLERHEFQTFAEYMGGAASSARAVNEKSVLLHTGTV
jgi:polysaccharide deacetylase family protein (PEP-CTERM system associated)